MLKKALLAITLFSWAASLMRATQPGTPVQQPSFLDLPSLPFATINLFEALPAEIPMHIRLLLLKHVAESGILDGGIEQTLASLPQEVYNNPIRATYYYNDQFIVNDPILPICLAAIYGNINAINFFIEHGADVNAISNSQLALHYAIISDHIDDDQKIHIVKYLLSRKANPNISIPFTHPPIIEALYHEAPIQIIADLLKYGTNPNAVLADNTHVPVLHIAIANQNPEVVKLLLAYGANPHITAANNQKTALQFTVEENDLGLSALLLEHGANPNTVSADNTRTSVLRTAIENQNFQIAELLLTKGADPNKTNSQGSTALHAVDDVELARLLLKHGANPEATNRQGATPLTAVMDSEEPNIELASLLQRYIEQKRTPQTGYTDPIERELKKLQQWEEEEEEEELTQQQQDEPSLKKQRTE